MQLTQPMFSDSAIFIEKTSVENQLLAKKKASYGTRICLPNLTRDFFSVMIIIQLWDLE